MWPRLALGDLLDKLPLTGQKEPTRKEGEKPGDRGWAQAAKATGGARRRLREKESE